MKPDDLSVSDLRDGPAQRDSIVVPVLRSLESRYRKFLAYLATVITTMELAEILTGIKDDLTRACLEKQFVSSFFAAEVIPFSPLLPTRIGEAEGSRYGLQ